MRFWRKLILSIIALSSIQVTAQDNIEHQPDSIHKAPKHQIGIMVGYAWVPQTIDEIGTNKARTIPTIGVDYSYWLSHKCAFKLINDLELSSYLVKDNDGELLERNNKLVTAITFSYEPIYGLGFYIGPGYEFDAHKNLPLIKMGVELVKNFNDGWSSGFNVSVDVNELYQTISAGVIISKRL
jgi:hypothetical protein